MSFIKPDGDVTDEFADLLVRCAAAYPSLKLSEATVRAYALALNDLTYPQVRVALNRLVRESRFWPSVADIRAAVVGSVEDAAVLAWAAAKRAAAEAGAYATVTFEDWRIASALETIFGTWPAFCALEEGPEAHVRRQEFLAAYRAARSPDRAPRTLRGLCDGGAMSFASLVGRVQRDGTVALLPQTALEKAR